MEVETGCVYFIRETVDTIPGLVKIGKAKCKDDRVRQLQCGNPRPLSCYKYIEVSYTLMGELEKHLHGLFAEYNTRNRYGKNSATEWFVLPHGNATIDNVLAALKYGRQRYVPIRVVFRVLTANRAAFLAMDSHRPADIETILQRDIPAIEFGTVKYTLEVKNCDNTVPDPAPAEIDRKKVWAAAEYRALYSRVTRAWIRGKDDPAIAQQGTDIIYRLNSLERTPGCRIHVIDGDEMLTCVDTAAELEQEVDRWREAVSVYEASCDDKKQQVSTCEPAPSAQADQ